MADEKEKKNIKALKQFRLKGVVVQKDEVVAKSEFAKKTDWQNLCNMSPTPRAAETSDPVGKPKAAAKAADDGGKLPAGA